MKCNVKNKVKIIDYLGQDHNHGVEVHDTLGIMHRTHTKNEYNNLHNCFLAC